MHDSNIILYNADSYKKIDDLVKKKVVVNHIITDPPYNISQLNNFHTMKGYRFGIDFGKWDSGEFDLYSWIPQYSKLLSKNGSVIIFCSYRYISFLIKACESKEADLLVKDIIVWQKSNPMPRNISRRYVQDMEFAVWAVKKKAKWTFNKPKNISYLRSIFHTPVVSGKEKLGHPTQKSLTLMENLISIHTNLNDVILDPFMGSGTTGEAAKHLGRKFIGIEQNQNFFEMAKKRLQRENL